MLEKIKTGLVSRLKKTKLNKKGFTLVELIVVIAIIAVLMAILVPTITGYVRDARVTAANANAKQVFVAAQTYLTKLEVAGTAAPASGDIDEGDLSSYLGSAFSGGVYIENTDYQVTAAWWASTPSDITGVPDNYDEDTGEADNINGIAGYYAQ